MNKLASASSWLARTFEPNCDQYQSLLQGFVKKNAFISQIADVSWTFDAHRAPPVVWERVEAAAPSWADT
jgi:hypothetical protein